MQILVGLLLLAGILSIPSIVVAATPGEEHQQARVLAFVTLAVVGFVGLALFSGFVETWRGYASFLVGWLAWLGKMLTTPLAVGVNPDRNGSYPDPGGVSTLFVVTCVTGIFLEFAFPGSLRTPPSPRRRARSQTRD